MTFAAGQPPSPCLSPFLMQKKPPGIRVLHLPVPRQPETRTGSSWLCPWWLPLLSLLRRRLEQHQKQDLGSCLPLLAVLSPVNSSPRACRGWQPRVSHLQRGWRQVPTHTSLISRGKLGSLAAIQPLPVQKLPKVGRLRCNGAPLILNNPTGPLVVG